MLADSMRLDVTSRTETFERQYGEADDSDCDDDEDDDDDEEVDPAAYYRLRAES